MRCAPAVVAILALVGCSADMSSLAILSLEPAATGITIRAALLDPLPNASSVPVNTRPVARFNLDGGGPASGINATSTTFPVVSRLAGRIDGVYEISGDRVRFNPGQNLTPGDWISVVATRQLQGDDGTFLGQPFVWEAWIDTAIAPASFLNFEMIINSSPHSTQAFVFGDLDRDGDVDVVLANSDAEHNHYGINDGTGAMSLYNYGASDSDSRALALADFDGDGFLDVAVGNFQQQNRIYLNNGNGGLSSGIDLGPGTDPTTVLAVGDINSDGAIDLVVGNEGALDRVYLNPNDGTAQFTIGSDIGTGAWSTSSVAIGDVNLDGSLDVVVAALNGEVSLFINDGSGGLTVGNVVAGAGEVRAVLLADLDGDRAPEVIIGRYNAANVLLYNDGGGDFPGPEVAFGDVVPTTALVVGDVDGDGDLDIVEGTQNGFATVVYINEGSQIFTSSPVPGTDLLYSQAVALADTDGDGDLDLGLGNFGGLSAVRPNADPNQPPIVTSVSASPSTLSSDILATTTITCDFEDADDPPAATLAIALWVNLTGDTTNIPLCSAVRDGDPCDEPVGPLSVVRIGAGQYTATFDWDPTAGISPGDYDVHCRVIDWSGFGDSDSRVSIAAITLLPCIPDSGVTADTVCNGYDDDCDGEIDEDHTCAADETRACYVGQCDRYRYECSSSRLTGCCIVDAECDGSYRGSLAGVCDFELGWCDFSSVPCAGDTECNDDNLCTVDACDLASGTCSYTAIPGCCDSFADCDDGEPCTFDECWPLALHRCVYTPICNTAVETACGDNLSYCYFAVAWLTEGENSPKSPSLRRGIATPVLQLQLDGGSEDALFTGLDLTTWFQWFEGLATELTFFADRDGDGLVDDAAVPLASMTLEESQTSVMFTNFVVDIAAASTSHYLVVMEVSKTSRQKAAGIPTWMLALLVLFASARSIRRGLPRFATLLLLLAFVFATPTACMFAHGSFDPVAQVSIESNGDVVFESAPTATSAWGGLVPMEARGAPISSDVIRIR